MKGSAPHIDLAQRDLIRQYARIQASRSGAEAAEAERRGGAERSENASVDRARGDVEAARRLAFQTADSERTEVTTLLGQILLFQTKADGLVHMLRRRGDLLASLPPVGSLNNIGEPGRALGQSVLVAQEALQEIDLALKELAELEKGAARKRLLLATAAVAAVTGFVGYLWGFTPSILLFPILVAAAIAAFRVDHGVVLLDRVISYAGAKRSQASAKPWYSVARNYFGGLTAIGNSTESIGNPYVQSGTRAAATMYFTGSAAGVILAAGYALMVVVVAIVVIGLVLWVIAKMLE